MDPGLHGALRAAAGAEGVSLNEYCTRKLATPGAIADPVTLPPAGRRVLGVWAEAAIDGVVLFERSLEVSRRLAGVRREIADGRIRRRTVHGQPYWVEAA